MGAASNTLPSSGHRSSMAPHGLACPGGNASLVVFWQFANTLTMPF
jgi:hypothetical protein